MCESPSSRLKSVQLQSDSVEQAKFAPFGPILGLSFPICQQVPPSGMSRVERPPASCLCQISVISTHVHALLWLAPARKRAEYWYSSGTKLPDFGTSYLGGQNLYTNTARRDPPTNTLKALWCI